MSVETFDYILRHLDSRITQQIRSKRVVTNPEKLFLTLRFLAHGLSFKSLSHSYYLGRSTVGKIIYQTLHVIWITLRRFHMPCLTENDFKKKADDYLMKWQFPNCIGAIGTKNFRIMKSENIRSKNKNSNKYCSLVLQAISDADYKFIAVEIVGKESKRYRNPFHFSASKFKKLLENQQFNVPPGQKLPGCDLTLPHVLLGNAGYPLKTYLLRPYPSLKADNGKKTFNGRLLRARGTIDFAFGILTDKWRIFLKSLETNTNHAAQIIKVACLLHNIVRDKDGDNDRDFVEFSNLLSNVKIDKVKKSKRNSRASFQAIAVRERYKDYFVNNPIPPCQQLCSHGVGNFMWT
ncbi:PREDICTED: uncharacterized protein LOC106123115 isoform X2 [Papilio xuthus]|nr:PREDICTED: uncharacterized protein LOC106123115 isoform X2 [Papilio xuthus]KPJ00652.1 hypothetical protein RR46_07491 [Papilio xuthus]